MALDVSYLEEMLRFAQVSLSLVPSPNRGRGKLAGRARSDALPFSRDWEKGTGVEGPFVVRQRIQALAENRRRIAPWMIL